MHTSVIRIERFYFFLFQEVVRNASFFRFIDGFMDRSRYAETLQKWFDVFPKHQIHVVDGDALVANPIHELRLTETFLGLRPYFLPEMFDLHYTKHYVCIKDSPNAQRDCRGQTEVSYAALDEEFRIQIEEYFRPFNIKLFQMIGRRFEWD